MTDSAKYIIGTSGYSFTDWLGPFYPPGTKRSEMFEYYARQFQALEVNFTFYAIPNPRILERMASRAPADFAFWVKANQETTHKQNRAVNSEFVANLEPLRAAGKLSGVLLQFPQSFRRTIENRKYLSAVLEDFKSLPAAVEFRHDSWDAPAALEALRERNVTLVVPDAPSVRGLFRPPPTATSRIAYLRLHSRDPKQWYRGMAERYDYLYSQEELKSILLQWVPLQEQVDRIYAFFNNCHRGQAAQNAEAFRRILGEIS